LITRCFEPDSIDLIKPVAVDEPEDDDNDEDGDIDIILSPIVSLQYRHIDLCKYLEKS
jgi:hypothetical protein